MPDQLAADALCDAADRAPPPVEARLVAEWLPGIEAVMVRRMNEQARG